MVYRKCNKINQNSEYNIMIQNILITALVSGLVLTTLYVKNGYGDVGTPTSPVVVELFTSQSCSSCPPADRILSKLTENDNVIALGFHVSYWNHLHWKDTFSREFSDLRQHGYTSIRGSNRVYTPQMVVNGVDEFVGSHASKVKAALKKAGQNPIKNINVTMNNDQQIILTLPMAAPDNYRLWAFGYQKAQNQDIKSGENSGKSVTYANPVISYTNLGAWDGNAAQNWFKKPNEEIDGIAIIAQSGGYGRIIAAGKYEF